MAPTQQQVQPPESLSKQICTRCEGVMKAAAHHCMALIERELSQGLSWCDKIGARKPMKDAQESFAWLLQVSRLSWAWTGESLHKAFRALMAL